MKRYATFENPPTAAMVREQRAAYGLTVKQAAALVHVTDNAWTKWEGAARSMDLAHWELFIRKAREIK